MIIYIKAPNDVNGNPRRGWIVEDGSTHVVGYEGTDALPEEHREKMCIAINVQAKEFKRLMRGGTNK